MTGQVRWFGDNDERNYPAKMNLVMLHNGTAVPHKHITKLRIQTSPGTKIYINQSVKPLIIGNSGVYTLDVSGLTTIESILFNEQSLNNIVAASGSVLIDYVYED